MALWKVSTAVLKLYRWTTFGYLYRSFKQFESNQVWKFRVFLSPSEGTPLHAFHNFLSLAMWLQVGPTYRIRSSHHLILRSLRVPCPRGIHSVSLRCPSVVTSHGHVARPCVFVFSYVSDNICHTTLFPDPVCTFSLLEGDSYHDSLHLPLGCDQFLKLGVAKRPGLTVMCHYCEYTFVECFPLVLLTHFCLTWYSVWLLLKPWIFHCPLWRCRTDVASL